MIRKKKKGFVCLILAGFSKKGNDDRSEKKWGWRCIPTISHREKCWEEYNCTKEAGQGGVRAGGFFLLAIERKRISLGLETL